jgi:hypothetical protein
VYIKKSLGRKNSRAATKSPKINRRHDKRSGNPNTRQISQEIKCLVQWGVLHEKERNTRSTS